MHLMCALAIKQCGDCGTKLNPALEQALQVAFDKHCEQWTLFENSPEQQRLKHKKEQVRQEMQSVIDTMIKPVFEFLYMARRRTRRNNNRNFR